MNHPAGPEYTCGGYFDNNNDTPGAFTHVSRPYNFQMFRTGSRLRTNNILINYHSFYPAELGYINGGYHSNMYIYIRIGSGIFSGHAANTDIYHALGSKLSTSNKEIIINIILVMLTH